MLKTTIFIFTLVVVFSTKSLYGQGKDYNEEEVRKLLDKYIENPKLYYEKIKVLNERADKANENTMKVSEEYLTILDKKDSLLKIYKNKAALASRMAPASSPAAPTAQVISSGTSIKPAPQMTTIVTKVQGKSELAPFRVQLAAYFREDFEKFFGSFNKTLGIQKLDNRNVIEVQGFKDEAEALEFSKKIQQLGFPGAFVTKYDQNGERQEGYKTDSKFLASETSATNNSTVPQAPKTSKNIQYPDYIPAGYKEHLKKNTEPAIVKAPVAPTSTPSAIPKARNIEPVQLKAPNIQRDAIISATPSTNSPVPQAQRPKAIASAAPVPNTTESATKQTTAQPATKTTTPTPPVNKNSRDQLDAAFDQLFKR